MFDAARIVSTIDKMHKLHVGSVSDDLDVFLFDDESKGFYDETVRLLKENGYSLVDVNEYVQIKSEDCFIPIKDAGFADESRTITINDGLLDDEAKARLITKAKLNRLESNVEDKTVLLIRYNEQILNNETLYEMTRHWLKDGYDGNEGKLVTALIFLETKEKIADYCRYGFNVSTGRV